MMNTLLVLFLLAGVQEDAAVESLIRPLDHDQPEERNRAAAALTALGEAVIPRLEKLDCASALADLKDLRAAPTLLEMAAALAIPVDGSKQATVHGFRQRGVAKALDRLLDTSAGWKDATQNTEALRKGQAVWQAALERARNGGK